MKKIFALIFLLISGLTFAQEDAVMYRWDMLQGANPDTIYGIDLSKMKLEELPQELEKYKQLRSLDLSKNKLQKLPDYLGDFDQLEILDASKNRLEHFPLPVCRMQNVKSIVLNRNYFDNLPECIGYLEQLEFIDLYDTPIRNLPEGLTKLKKLKKIDLSGIRFAPSFQDKWKALLPTVEIEFDPPCECME